MLDAVEVLIGHLQEVFIRVYLQEDLDIFPKMLVNPQGMFKLSNTLLHVREDIRL